jgi:cell division protein FtsL
MSARRKNLSQAAPLHRRKSGPVLKVVPSAVKQSAVSFAEQSVSGVRRRFLRAVDFHPALTLLLVVAIVALVCVIYLRQVTAVANANYELQALQAEHADLIREQQELQVEIGRAQSLSHIEEVARNNLHMVPLEDSYTYLMIPPGPIAAMTPRPTSEAAQPSDGP